MNKHIIRYAGLLVAAGILTGTAEAVPVSGQGTWETTLQARDLDGNLSTAEAYYDTALNITWLADANFAQTSGYDADGAMNWAAAGAWADGLVIGSFTEWRLPYVQEWLGGDCTYSGGNCIYNVGVDTGELAHMYYVTLANTATYDTAGSPQPGGLTNSGPFVNLGPQAYWYGREFAPDTTLAWYSYYGSGSQYFQDKNNQFYAWAVHAGDIGTTTVVPVPAAAWLFASGLMGLLGVSRRRMFREA